MVYSTYLGGSPQYYGVGWTRGRRIAIDGLGNAYVTGSTESWDFPITPGALNSGLGGQSCAGCYGYRDESRVALITKLNPVGSKLVYSATLGGVCYAFSSGVAVDKSGNAFVAGSTEAMDFPVTPGAFQTTICDRCPAVFVSKLNAIGSALVYSTYLGGDAGRGIVVDPSGNAYVTGSAGSGFPPFQAPRRSLMAGTGTPLSAN